MAHHFGLETKMDPDSFNVVKSFFLFFPGGTEVTVQHVVQDRW